MASKSGRKATTTKRKSQTKRNTQKKTGTKNTKNIKKTGNTKNTRNTRSAGNESSFLSAEILIWSTLAVSILPAVSSFGLGGFIGDKIAGGLQYLFGWIAYVFPFLLFGGVAFTVSNKGNSVAYIKTISGVVLMVQLCILLQMIDDRGGLIGEKLTDILVPAIGTVGTYVVVLILMVICIVLITEKSILGGMKKGSSIAYDRARVDMQRRKEEAKEKKAQKLQAREQTQKESLRMEHQVSGVSFNTTPDAKEAPAAENKAEEAQPKRKATRRTGQDVNTALAGAQEAAARHIMEQTGQISAG